jgi:hypothetical protein
MSPTVTPPVPASGSEVWLHSQNWHFRRAEELLDFVETGYQPGDLAYTALVSAANAHAVLATVMRTT